MPSVIGTARRGGGKRQYLIDIKNANVAVYDAAVHVTTDKRRLA
jgi:hypothetical protein